MVKGTVRVARSGNGLQPLVDRLKALSKKEVYVGIPQEKSSRPAGGDSINNAELLYIHTHGVRSQDMRQEMEEKTKQGMKYSAAHSLYVQSHGSPVWAIPPRPVLEPAIEDSKDVIGEKLAMAAKAAADGDAQRAERSLEMAGMAAQNAARAWFENPKNGWPPNSPKTIRLKGSNSPLIDTGEMRKAITYVVKDKR